MLQTDFDSIVDLAEYYFPESVNQWPGKIPALAQEARRLLKTPKGRAILTELRQEWKDLQAQKQTRQAGRS